MAEPTPDSTASLMLRCEFHCTSTNSKEEKRLVFPDSPPSIIGDIKAHVQSHFSIPKCLQKLSFNGQVLDDSISVSDHYIRSHDCLSLSYLCEADVDFILEFTQSTLVLLAKHLTGSLPTLSNDMVDDFLHVCSMKLHNLAFQKLSPWHSSRSEANRQLLFQENSLRLILNIYAQILKEPYDDRSESTAKLEISILMFVWNFSETRAARMAVFKMGGFDLVLKSLEHSSMQQNYRIHNEFDQVAGVISNYCELECCRKAAACHQVTDKLLAFSTMGSSLNIFTHMLIANFLFRMTFSFDFHPQFVEASNLNAMLAFYRRFSSPPSYAPNLAIKYALCLAFARLLLFSSNLVSVEHQCQITDLQFLTESTTTLKAINAFEKQYTYNWTTVVPFMEMLYAPLVDQTEDVTDGAPLVTLCRVWGLRVALLALQAEMQRALLRELARKEGLVDYVVMLPWGVPPRWKDECLSVVRWFRSDSQLPVPRLCSIARAVLARSGATTGLRDI